MEVTMEDIKYKSYETPSVLFLNLFQQLVSECCTWNPNPKKFKVCFQEFEHCEIVCLSHASGVRGLTDEYIASFKPEMAEILNSYKM